jgi:hypothetical protein
VSVVTASLASREGSLHWPLVWTVVVAALLYWGMHAHLELYITPKRGFGYWLGIAGGSMMVLLLIYSARKRVPWLKWIGSTTGWFRIHMALGVVGPVLILFHSNFQLGASNSNVALICMLLVAGSGVVGRYIYTRLHARMDGHQDTLEQLKAVGEKMRAQTNAIAFVPGVVDAIERVEKRFIQPPNGAVAPLLHTLTGGARSFIARWLVRREIKRAVGKAIKSKADAGGAAVIARHAAQIGAAASRYAERRLEAGRRVAEYQTYARLFSYWHVLHIPLFYIMLISAVVHIVAVNLY